MAGRKKFDIGDAIVKLRELRGRFVIDTPSKAYSSTENLVARLWPLQAAQMDQAKMHLHIYEPDPKAVDQAAEQKKRTQSAMLGKLALPVWGYNPDTPRDTQTRVEELARDLALSAKDGLLPHERRVPHKIKPLISSETLRHNQSLLPRQRKQLFDRGLDIPPVPVKRKGRKRIKPVGRNDALRKTLFLRSRHEWRLEEIFSACEALHAVAQWVDQRGQRDKDVLLYARRYKLEELRLSKSKHAPSTFSERLAIAIASAKHTTNGKDEYTADDAMAVHISYYYGLFLQAVKLKPRRRAIAFLNKLMILQGN